MADSAANISTPTKTRKQKGPTSVVNATLDNPKTLGERITARRLELGLHQGNVADRVKVLRASGAKQGKEISLSRSTLCQYETGSGTPDLPKLIALAEALQCTPEWLAFGVTGPQTLDEASWTGDAFVFQASQWAFPKDWLQELNGSTADLAVIVCDDFTPSLKPGDVALVDRSASPNTSGAEFVFAIGDAARTAYVSKRGDQVRVFDRDLSRHEDYPAEAVTFLGKVVGKLGGL
jgi:transcriptional regulator with XRE-family HTH domain